MCQLTGAIYVNIKQIPNQPLVFKNDWKEKRQEDGIIALTWRHFLEYPDQPEWLIRFPMVKACLRLVFCSYFVTSQVDRQDYMKTVDRLTLVRFTFIVSHLRKMLIKCNGYGRRIQ